MRRRKYNRETLIDTMQICIPRSQKDRCRIREKGAGSGQKRTKYTNSADASARKAYIYGFCSPHSSPQSSPFRTKNRGNLDVFCTTSHNAQQHEPRYGKADKQGLFRALKNLHWQSVKGNEMKQGKRDYNQKASIYRG